HTARGSDIGIRRSDGVFASDHGVAYELAIGPASGQPGACGFPVPRGAVQHQGLPGDEMEQGISTAGATTGSYADQRDRGVSPAAPFGGLGGSMRRVLACFAFAL